MKPAEIRELSDAQLVEKLKEMRAELFNLRFQMATSQLDNTARVNTVKKDIARVLTEQRAREIAAILLDLYDRGQVEKIYVVYTDMKNGLVAEPKQTRLLPFHRAQFFSDTAERAVSVPFEFTPSVGAVLDNVIASYVSGFIYSALVDSFCCEQNARMRAMDSANRNAEKILADLTTAYNRVRQSAITQEITEVSAGAKAQRLAAHTRETKEADADAYR